MKIDDKIIIRIGRMTCTTCAQTIEKATAQRPVLCALSNNPGQAIGSYDRDTVVVEGQ